MCEMRPQPAPLTTACLLVLAVDDLGKGRVTSVTDSVIAALLMRRMTHGKIKIIPSQCSADEVLSEWPKSKKLRRSLGMSTKRAQSTCSSDEVSSRHVHEGLSGNDLSCGPPVMYATGPKRNYPISLHRSRIMT